MAPPPPPQPEPQQQWQGSPPGQGFSDSGGSLPEPPERSIDDEPDDPFADIDRSDPFDL
jgi:hypothetical protein